MKQQILNRYSGVVIYECELPDRTENAMKMALLKAVAEEADLRYADLQSANLRYADLQSADLRYADLRYANLRYADLQSADLRYANLRYADLRYANLRYADLRYGKLIGDRPYFSISPIGSRQDTLTLWLTDKGAMLKTGCFEGTFEEFEKQLESEHGENDHAKEYRAALELCKVHSEIWTPKP